MISPKWQFFEVDSDNENSKIHTLGISNKTSTNGCLMAHTKELEYANVCIRMQNRLVLHTSGRFAYRMYSSHGRDSFADRVFFCIPDDCGHKNRVPVCKLRVRVGKSLSLTFCRPTTANSLIPHRITYVVTT